MFKRYQKQKIASTIKLVEEFDSIEFPHHTEIEALNIYKEKLEKLLWNLDLLHEFNAVNETYEEVILESEVYIEKCLELLGIISNSSNVRNAFEAHGPLLYIAQKFLGDQAKLLLSFEWTHTPFTYPRTFPLLKEYILIGLPASESENALALPAFGHELGHSIWKAGRGSRKFADKLNTEITDIIQNEFWNEFHKFYPYVEKAGLFDPSALDAWEEAHSFAIKQLEETFCDFIGLYLFGRSYLRMTEYYLTPFDTERDVYYPSLSKRAEYLRVAAKHLNIGYDAASLSVFKSTTQSSDDARLAFQLSIADAAVDRLVEDLLKFAIRRCKRAHVTAPKDKDSKIILDCFMKKVPGRAIKDLAAIINAGWDAFCNKQFCPGDSDESRLHGISELSFKSIEIFELEQLVGRHAI